MPQVMEAQGRLVHQDTMKWRPQPGQIFTAFIVTVMAIFFVYSCVEVYDGISVMMSEKPPSCAQQAAQDHPHDPAAAYTAVRSCYLQH
ncbi:MAG TPA: hypothetical protein VLE72_04610 [Candidatus Saccharimonadales bacterium]|nr:hypothetical protein [Candidatus Saccharimonadales bacterium]